MSSTSALDASNQAVSPALIGGTLPPLGRLPPSRLAWATLPPLPDARQNCEWLFRASACCGFHHVTTCFEHVTASDRRGIRQKCGGARTSGRLPGGREDVEVHDQQDGPDTDADQRQPGAALAV